MMIEIFSTSQLRKMSCVNGLKGNTSYIVFE